MNARFPVQRWFGLWAIAFMTSIALAETPARRPLTIDDVMAYRPVREAILSPNGQFVVFVVSKADLDENVFNTDLWLVRTIPDAQPFQLTRGPKADRSPQWSPDGSRIAFLSDRTGKTQIWLISPTGGEAEQLTRVETGVVAFRWSSDGRRIAFTAKEPETEEEKKRKEEWGDYIVVDEDLDRNRLYVIDIETQEVQNLTPDADFHVDAMDWSPDDTHIVFSARPTPKVPDRYHTDLYIVPSDGSAPPRKLVDRAGLDTNPRWSPDGRWIAFVSGDGKVDWVGNTYLCLVSPDGDVIRNLTRTFDERILSFTWAPDGRWLYFRAGHRMTLQIYAVEVATGTVVPLTRDEAVYTAFSIARDGRTAAFLRQDSQNPPDVYIAQLEHERRRVQLRDVRRVTDMNPQIREFTLGVTERFEWKAPDGLTLDGLLVKPVGYEEGKRYPLLVVIHGGPAGVFIHGFYLRRGAYPIQVFANEGYLVFLPNPRGSGFYGERFRKMNFRDWGGKDYEDIMAGVQALIDRGLADPERMGVMGWSYGGYMTSWIITQTNRFRAASVGAGVTDLFSMFGTTDIPPFMLAHFGKPPWEDLEVYLKRSAMYHVANVRTPTLIQHGDRDVRVPTFQSWELYTALRMRGVPVRFILYPRQPHGIREPKLVRAVMKHNLDWFHRWLKGFGDKAALGVK